MNFKSFYLKCVVALLVVCASGLTVFAQEKSSVNPQNEFCQNYENYNNDKVSFSEAREITLPAANLLEVNGERNGGVKIKGADRADVLVRACVRSYAATDEAARNLARSVKIETAPIIRAADASAENSWTAVSYEIFVPRQTNLKLTTHNGGIGITGVTGKIEFDANNGGVNLENLAGDVRGKTRNGGLRVTLSGNTWSGAGLDVETTNGGVHLSLPETYAANLETGTTNGGFKSDIAALQVERKERQRALKLNTNLNGGGAPVRVVTTNGGVKINSN